MSRPTVTLEFEPANVHQMSGLPSFGRDDDPTPEVLHLSDDALSRTIYIVEETSQYDWMTGSTTTRTKVGVVSIASRSKARIVVDWQPEPEAAELPF